MNIYDGGANNLDISFDEIGGIIHVTVSDGEDPYAAQIDLLESSDATAVLERQGPNPFFMTEEEERGETFPQSGATLEPGEYLIRAYRPESGGSTLEESVQVVAGRTTNVHFDLGIAEIETEKDGIHVGVVEDDVEGLTDTIDAP
ncbi:MAG: hypothetical protein JNK74_22075 [Candidatus Hydrogenedentes bacterium]|nr:hypothetical protein [Candidatus Hydrogenedentota bacterium]